jgi:AcrR family transcriptional regulator
MARPTLSQSGQPAPRPRGRRHKDQPPGRDALLKAATSAFARHGYDSVDLRSLAAAANVDAGLVRVHFGGKEGLWLASVEDVAAQTDRLHGAIRDLTAEPRPVGDRLADAIRLFVAFSFEHPELSLFIAQQTRESGERLAALTERLILPAIAATDPLFAEAIREGVTPATDPTIAFTILGGALLVPTTAPELPQSLLTPPVDRDTFRERLQDNLIALFLPGHRPQKERS